MPSCSCCSCCLSFLPPICCWEPCAPGVSSASFRPPICCWEPCSPGASSSFLPPICCWPCSPGASSSSRVFADVPGGGEPLEGPSPRSALEPAESPTSCSSVGEGARDAPAPIRGCTSTPISASASWSPSPSSRHGSAHAHPGGALIPAKERLKHRPPPLHEQLGPHCNGKCCRCCCTATATATATATHCHYHAGRRETFDGHTARYAKTFNNSQSAT